MSDMNPHPITIEEWEQIIAVPAIREAWGLADETTEEFASRVYGAKFDFSSGSPGYFGELYILQGDALTGAPPIVLRRGDNDVLIVSTEQTKLSDELSKAIAGVDSILDNPNSVHEGEVWEKFVGLRNRMEALRVELNTSLEDSFDWDKYWNARDEGTPQ
jgi:hypothetical protein